MENMSGSRKTGIKTPGSDFTRGARRLSGTGFPCSPGSPASSKSLRGEEVWLFLTYYFLNNQGKAGYARGSLSRTAL